MMRNRLTKRARGHAGRLRIALALAAAAVLTGCGGGSLLGGSSDSGFQFQPLDHQPVQRTVRLEVASRRRDRAAAVDNELSCPSVTIRAGASTFAVGAPGKEAVGNDLRYQATITRTARDCHQNGGEITARIGILGRVIVGPAGAPPTVEIPLRVAVVQGGVQEKTITTKVFRTTVTINDQGSVPFSLVAEDVVYPVPPGATGDSYIFYIGFDPQALTPAPAPRAARKKK